MYVSGGGDFNKGFKLYEKFKKRFYETGNGIKCSCNIIEKPLFNRRKSRQETDGDGLNAASEVVAVAINMASGKDHPPLRLFE